jgi:hypothetical protein
LRDKILVEYTSANPERALLFALPLTGKLLKAKKRAGICIPAQPSRLSPPETVGRVNVMLKRGILRSRKVAGARERSGPSWFAGGTSGVLPLCATSRTQI